MRLILASASPRRRDLLEQIGVVPIVEAADVDEAVLPNENPTSYVERVARDKAQAVLSRNADAVVLAADTAVIVDEEILGKPTDAVDADHMLRRLSGGSHQVLTAVAVAVDGEVVSDVAVTTVRFHPLADDEIEDYVASGDPLDKAGAYGLQGAASMFVESIHGPVDNVIGLPRRLVFELFERQNLRLGDFVGT